MQEAQHDHSRQKSYDSGSLEGIKVLLVDDCPDNQILFSHSLKWAGALVDIVDSGMEAVQAAMQKNYDIILMDIQMPLMDGFETTQKIRAMGFDRPIVALTAFASDRDGGRFLHKGFDRFLAKPTDRDKLIATVLGIVMRPSLANLKD